MYVPAQHRLMNMAFALAETFGTHVADVARAAEFRMARIEPYVDLCDEITLDFAGVRHANSSFINALVAGIVEQHGRPVLDKLVFKGANPVLRVLIQGAIVLGLQKIEGRIDA